MELTPGDDFAGHRIEGVAGRGGMGVVYRATELTLDRIVALKTISPALAADPSFRERFVAESKAAAGIDHPNVLPIFSAGEEDEVPYIAMRFVEGPDLRTLVRAGGPFAPERAAAVVAQVGSALDAAHARGLVHRDVKPANVLLDTGDHAYLTDFGLTKRLGTSATRAGGGWVGTLGYVAPEQIRDERIDGRADVYALGCVLHHLLTGAPPFERSSDEATLWAHLHDPPPVAPGPLGPVVARALAKDPAERYGTPGDLGRAALAAVGRPAPTLRRPTRRHAPHSARGAAGRAMGRSDRRRAAASAPRAASRRRRAPLLALLAVLLLAGGAAAALLLGGDDEEPGPSRSTTRASTTPGRHRGRRRRAAAERDRHRAQHRVRVAPARQAARRRRPRALRRGEAELPHRPGRHRPRRGLRRAVGRGRAVRRPPRSRASTSTTASRSARRFRRASPSRSRAATTPSGSASAAIRRPSSRVDPETAAVTQTLRDPHRRPGPRVRRRGRLAHEPRRGHAHPHRPAHRRRSASSRAGRDPAGLTHGAGAVWTASTGDDSVVRIDRRDPGDRATIGVPGQPRAVGYGGGRLWVASFTTSELVKIDGETGRRLGPAIPTALNPTKLLVGADAVYVISAAGGRLERVPFERR